MVDEFVSRCNSPAPLLVQRHVNAASKNSKSYPNPFQTKVLQLLVSIKNQVQHNTKVLNSIKSNTNEEDGDFPSDEEIESTFPLKTVRDLQNFENVIDDNPALKRKWINYFGQTGGNSVSSTTKNILKAMLTYELAMNFNWCGRGDKMPFSNLTIVAVIFDSVNKNKILEGVSRNAVADAIKGWLRFAPDRVEDSRTNRLRQRK